MKKIAKLAIILSCLTTLVACNSANKEDSKELTSKQFVDKINSICVQATKAADKLPKVGTENLDNLVTSFNKQAKIQQEQLDSLEKINANKKDNVVLAQIKKLIGQKVAALEEVSKTIKDGNNNRSKINKNIIKPWKEFTEINKKLTDIALENKFTGCAKPLNNISNSTTSTTVASTTSTTAK